MSSNSFETKVKSLSEILRLGNSLNLGNTSPNITNELLRAECTLIKSDNLPALISMIDNGIKIDFCYIDPPYNTGSRFVYADSRSSPTPGIWGKHNEWLTFMLPRLVAAQMLLTETGVISVSIDDYEYPYLKILMDHVFGEKNYIATLILCRSKNGKGGKANVAVNHEYILIYGKTARSKLHGLLEVDLSKYDRSDEHGVYTVDGLFRKKGDASRREDRPNMYYPLYCSQDGRVFLSNERSGLKEVWPVDSKGVERRWLWGREKAQLESWKLYASPGGTVYVKNYMREGKRKKIRSILDDASYLNDKATTEIKSIYGEKVFETPKPIGLIRDIIEFCSAEDALVLDFFAGTGTTAHANRTLNAEEGARRKCILVEHTQPIATDHFAVQHGFATTADITEFRLKHMQSEDSSFHYSILEL